MSEERLQEIKDSIDLQYKVLEIAKAENAKVFVDEEKELYDEVLRLNNIINELKWKPIEEYDKGNYDWVLVKYFDKDFECIPCVAEKKFDKWYNRNDEVIEFDVKYFMDMQQIDKLQEPKGSDKDDN